MFINCLSGEYLQYLDPFCLNMETTFRLGVTFTKCRGIYTNSHNATWALFQ